MQIEVEILRTRTITVDESAVVEVEVPDSVPEGGRSDWILTELSEDRLKVSDKEFEVSDESEDIAYHEVNETF